MKNFKKSLCVILTAMLLILTVTPVLAASNISVKVDGKKITFDVQPRLIGGRTMVPLRAIFEALNATVNWDEETRTITAYNEAYFVKSTIGENEMFVNNQRMEIDIAPMIVEGRTLVPARFVAEAFNCDVEWNAAELTVYITSKPIDYTQMEKDTDFSPVIPIPSTTDKKDTENSAGMYYLGTSVPTYTYVTGIELTDLQELDSGSVCYIYPDTKTGEYSEMVDYAGYFMENDWIEIELDEDEDYDSFSLAYYNPENLEGVLIMCDFDTDQIYVVPTKSGK